MVAVPATLLAPEKLSTSGRICPSCERRKTKGLLLTGGLVVLSFRRERDFPRNKLVERGIGEITVVSSFSCLVVMFLPEAAGL